MTLTSGAPVVVGIDGSDAALAAVRLGAAEAALRQRPLRLVHAFIWPLMRVPLGPDPLGPPEGGLANEAERLAVAAAGVAEEAAPGLTVTSEVVVGAPAAVMLREARDAHMIVLGDRGLGGFGALVLGSVAVQVASHATCPILVARGTIRASGPVVVGVDGSEVSGRAVGFAFEEASLRGAPLVALHAWRFPVSGQAGDMLPLVYDAEQVAEEEEPVLAAATAGWSERYPEVTCTRSMRRARPAKALVEESERAQLVVVGARGRGGFTGLLLGSVSHAVLHHGRCPVAIVHQ
jgi:nucleotide-binding universal stress UspA family protein